MKNVRDNARVVADFLKGIASTHRLLILCELTTGEKSVTELIEATGIAQTSMSQHLSKLKEEKIVTFRRDHRLLFYRINNKAVIKIMDVLYHEFCKQRGRKK
jgi:ArsR family transcriptional regulator, virulence genes transcriptional regulator